MKKIAVFLVLCFFTVTAQAKDKLGIVFAGSLGGSFNKFNSALSQDLSQWYDIEEISTGGSSTKGGKIFSSIDDRAVFMMSETAKRNVVNAIKGKEPFVVGVSAQNLVWGGKYYKSLCTLKDGEFTPDDAFVEGNALKVAISDGPKMGNHIFDNFNRIVKTNHSIVPYSGSGKQLAALQTSDVDIALINDAKAVRGVKEGTLNCDYSTNPSGGNMANSLAGGMIAKGIRPARIWMSDPSQDRLDEVAQLHRVHVSRDNLDVARRVDVLVLAVNLLGDWLRDALNPKLR